MYRPTYVKIENDILTNNIKEIISKYNNYKYYIGVVKANAYGHGDYIVNDLIKGGVNYLAVSSLEEAVSIRKYNQEIPILCLEPINLEHLSVILENDITITIESLEYTKELLKLNPSKKLKIHLKLDTGMSRLGFTDQQNLDKTISLIKENKHLYLEGIYTHLATSGINDIYYDKQINKFKELTSNIDLSTIDIVHLNRSITLTHHQKLPFETGTRLGIIMYGFSQSINSPTGLKKIKRNFLHKIHHISPTIMENDLNLKTAFSLHTEVISIRNIKKGDFAGYGANYLAKEDMMVATLPIGYADGISASMKYVSINDKKYEIVGDICMDMTLVKVDKNVKLHDKVEIFGHGISIKSVARNMQSNAYHVLTGITTRVPRIYQDGKEIKY